MDRRVVPFLKQHYDWIAETPSAERGSFVMSPEVAGQIESANSHTWVVDGSPVVCAGTVQYWPGRHLAWAYVASGTLRHMPWVTEGALARLASVQGRIELTVRCDFLPGHRWAKRLGFEVETPCMKGFGPAGESHTGFVRHN